MPDDLEINNLPNSTLFWMLAMINKDEEEQIKKEMDLVEYLASFVSPENLRRMKEIQETTVKVSEESFMNTMGKISKNQI